MWKTVRFGEADVELDVQVGFLNVCRERREWLHDGCVLRVFDGRRLVAERREDGDFHPKLIEALLRSHEDDWFREWVKGSYQWSHY